MIYQNKSFKCPLPVFPADDVSNDRDCTDVRDAAQVAAVERLEVGAVRLSQNLFDVLQTLKINGKLNLFPIIQRLKHLTTIYNRQCKCIIKRC